MNVRRFVMRGLLIAGGMAGVCMLAATVYAVCRRWPGLCHVLIFFGCLLFAAAVCLLLALLAAYVMICARARRLRRLRPPAVDRVGADGFLRFRVRI